MDLPPAPSMAFSCPADMQVVCDLLGCARPTLYAWLRDHNPVPEHARLRAMDLLVLRRIAQSGTVSPDDLARIRVRFERPDTTEENAP